ncbi:MAG TPA: hypothetical protein PKE47_10560, partial [Verrucomicrobiota bacterium]|nr:hypothetical protein [Verrucomicrobiota bacterium]
DHAGARVKRERERRRREPGAGGGAEERPRSPEERARRIREVFGLPADPAAAPPGAPEPGIPPGTSTADGDPSAGLVG